jgi:hypothetical protein
MKIAVVSMEFPSGPDTKGPGADVAALAKGLVSLDHEVRAITLLPSKTDPNTSSLARRLTPIEVSVGRKKTKCVRYDGRTSHGIETHLLEMQSDLFDGNTAGYTKTHAEMFSKGAAELLKSLHTKPDWTICWDGAAALVPALCKQAPDLAGCTRHLLNIATLDGDPEMLGKGINASDQVMGLQPAAAQALKDPSSPLSSMIADGRAVALPRPVDTRCTASPTQKSSAKTACQTSLGLPVKQDVLLVLFSDPDADAHHRALDLFLRGDVQAIAFDDTGRLKELAARYPDRLGLIPDDTPADQVLCAVDGCVVGNQRGLPTKSLALGSVPIVALDWASGLVDLEPSLQSGSSIIIDGLNADALTHGLGRLSAAFKAGSEFQALLTRLPGFVLTWEEAAKRYEQLLTENLE